MIPLAVCVIVLVVVVRLWRRPSIGAKLVAAIDSDPEGNCSITTRAARMAAYAFKAEFGELRYNKANWLVAGDWVRKHFRDMGMRNVDIVRHMDIAVELCLLPTEAAVLSSSLARTREVRERRSAVDLPK
jgi:hypothetical protein